MKTFIALAAAGVLLAGCSSEPAAPENTQAQAQNISPEDNVAAKVDAMSEQQRNVVLIRAIRDAGMDCQGVTESQPWPDAGPNSYRAKCSGGDYHLVQIKADGTATVISRNN